MSWLSLVTVLLELFRPLFKKWLEDLLKKAERDLTKSGADVPGSATTALAIVFSEARAEVIDTYWFPWTKRRALKALDAWYMTAVVRANEVHNAAVGAAPNPDLTGKEYDALVNL